MTGLNTKGRSLFDFDTFPKLETQRLTLRQIHLSDAQAIFAFRGDYEVTKYNIGQAYESIGQARELIESMQRAFDWQDSIRWGITVKPHHKVIGMCGYNYWDRDDRRASIGFDLHRDYWRRGIMREAITAIVQFGFDEMKLHRVEADASIYNVASIKLLKSLGFQQEGIQREQYFEDDTFHDLVLFGLLRQEWKPQKQNE